MEALFGWFDWILFFLCTCFTVYLFSFSLFSLQNRKKRYPAATRQQLILVLFPAYREDAVIVDSIRNFKTQDYPASCYDIVVISDGMQEQTVNVLKTFGVHVLIAHFENSSKAAALQLAVRERADHKLYDVVVVMDADNHVNPDFLSRLNDAYSAGARAIQAHRVPKNKNSDIAYLDGLSEEINNSIFRKGHVNAGLSSALSGSGMAFDFTWFKQNITKIESVGEDKELEMLLLLDKIRIEFLDDLPVWDEKVQTRAAFSGQRQRWITAQYEVLCKAVTKLPGAIVDVNIDYCNKIFQWLMPPRVILVGTIPLIALLVGIFDWKASLKWIFLYSFLVAALGIALPKEMRTHQLKSAIRHVPLLFLSMLFNMLRVQRNKGGFIHTPHGEK